MQVVSLRGSNLIEVLDAKGIKSLALFPAKFQKSFWIKRGNYVVVDASGMDKALESGSKIACVISQVLFHEQVKTLEKSPDWPDVFKNPSTIEKISDSNSTSNSNLNPNLQEPQLEDDDDEEEDDNLPPLEANTNRNRPFEEYSNSDSDSES
ncbi:hypothetical protein LUZ60_015446 [Juncus effusus]|nr:hypothetical protein LUZ60_015446 [Juncus effusus]